MAIRWAPTGNPYSHIQRGWYRVGGRLSYFRSKDEALLAEFLERSGWEWEYEPKRFRFEDIDSGTTSYTPDFRAFPRGSPQEYRWFEVKGWLSPKSRTKLRRFARYYPEEARRLVLVVDNVRSAEAFLAKINGEVARRVEIWPMRKIRSLVSLNREVKE